MASVAAALALVTLCTVPLEADDQEPTFLAVLQSGAPAADKAIACKQLAIHGSERAVPELAQLLPDPHLHSWARIALEAIPGDAADAALRDALESLHGRLLVGAINSVGVRRDGEAVTILLSHLESDDPQVASAAAVALGRIANDTAAKALRTALTQVPADVRSAVAEGCVLCAERRLLEGQMAAAAEIYDEIRAADVPLQRKVEATRGAILARGDEGIPLLVDTLRSPERKLFQVGLATAREMPNEQVVDALAKELTEAEPPRAALIVLALADRPTTVSRTAILAAAERNRGDENRAVRLAAIEALGQVGDESCLNVLLDIANLDDAELRQAARETLTELPGSSVDAQIVNLLRDAHQNQTLLLYLIGQRRIDAVTDVMKVMDHADASVRGAALAALGETVSLERLPVLISAVVNPRSAQDFSFARDALRAASVRMPDRDACARQLTDALTKASSESKPTLLEILSEVGGATALATVHAAASSSDPILQDEGSRLLGKWNSVDAAAYLLDLASNAPAEKFRIRALRGYIGLARKFPMPEPERVAMCQKALSLARRSEDQELILDVLKLHPSAGGLQLTIEAKERSELKDAATSAALAIAQNLAGEGVDLKRLLGEIDLAPVDLEIVQATYGVGNQQKDVTELLRSHAGKSRVIVLPANNYNASLGGDPAPNQKKQLVVEYRINDKLGKASFPENALILLPQP